MFWTFVWLERELISIFMQYLTKNWLIYDYIYTYCKVKEWAQLMCEFVINERPLILIVKQHLFILEKFVGIEERGSKEVKLWLHWLLGKSGKYLSISFHWICIEYKTWFSNIKIYKELLSQYISEKVLYAIEPYISKPYYYMQKYETRECHVIIYYI
jgi:hypothetical protein